MAGWRCRARCYRSVRLCASRLHLRPGDKDDQQLQGRLKATQRYRSGKKIDIPRSAGDSGNVTTDVSAAAVVNLCAPWPSLNVMPTKCVSIFFSYKGIDREGNDYGSGSQSENYEDQCKSFSTDPVVSVTTTFDSGQRCLGRATF